MQLFLRLENLSLCSEKSAMPRPAKPISRGVLPIRKTRTTGTPCRMARMSVLYGDRCSKCSMILSHASMHAMPALDRVSGV